MIDITEEEIMADWQRTDGPGISVKCLAYNHEKYIADALNSFLMQKTKIPFEVIVHDDASIDGTAAIISEYHNKYPQIVKPIYESENQYSKGSGIMNQIIDSHIQGKYVAVCEGDDYWTDENKLQSQFEAMEKHPEVDICAHAVRKINAKSGKTLGIISPEKKNIVIPVERVIAGGGGFVGTNSLFYRKSAFDNILPFRRLLEIDYTLQVQGSLRGGMLYLNKCMADYRFMSEGSWSSSCTNEDKVKKMDAQWKAMANQLDIDTNKKYHSLIDYYVSLRDIDNLLRFKHYTELKQYQFIYKSMNGNGRIKYFLMLNFPKMYSVLKRVRDEIKS